MARARIPDGTIRRILEDERSSGRFEDFCCELLTHSEGIDYMGTSCSHDLGRDGRTPPLGPKGRCGYVACSTTARLEDKLEADLARMLQYAQPETIYFVTNRFVSEPALLQIEETMRKLAPNVNRVAVIGGHQLLGLIQRHPSAFERRYAGELLEHAQFLSRTSQDNRGEDVLGMQVALATQFDENALRLRGQLLRRLVLRALGSGASIPLGVIAKAVSDALRLPQLIHPAYFHDTTQLLCDDGLVEEGGGVFWITDAGRNSLAADQAAASSGLVRGQEAIRAALERLLGERIDNASFDGLWRLLVDEFANLFFAQGLKVVQGISTLTRDPATPAPRRTFTEMLEAMRRRIIQLRVGGGRSEAFAQAVVDLFGEQGSSAASWLTEVGVKYVSLCSLGLEPAAQQEVCGRLKEIDIIVDTDVVLSYLSEGERPHKAIRETLDRWRQIGGAAFVVGPVLEETAYHAWISEFEYSQVWREFRSLSPEEMPRYVKNAFVRAFFFAAKGEFEPRQWNRFISEYRAHNPDDTHLMHELLEDHGFQVTENLGEDSSFCSDVRQAIYHIRKIDEQGVVAKQVADKVARDARIVAHLKVCREGSPSRYHTTVIISSSPTLQRAASQFSDVLGEPNPVWPIGSLAYLVSLVPGVGLTLNTLRNCLFAEGEFDSGDDLTQFAMRVIRKSKQYSLGYSQRPTLRRALHQQIRKAAQERGQPPVELTEELLRGSPENRELLTEVIAKAVDGIQASEKEKEIGELRARIRELESR